MRVRVRYGKEGKLRWLSHRDVARIWERAFRRLELPLAYTQGFSPRPKVSFGLALPTGAESRAEYLDIELDGELDVVTLPARLASVIPAGMSVSAAAVVDDRADSLQHEVTSCAWEIDVRPNRAGPLPEAVRQVLTADSLVVKRERKGSVVTDDIRPAILDLRVELGAGANDTSGAVLYAELATQPRGLRPNELLAALGVEVEDASVRRTHQWIGRAADRREPLAVADGAPPASLDRLVGSRAV